MDNRNRGTVVISVTSAGAKTYPNIRNTRQRKRAANHDKTLIKDCCARLRQLGACCLHPLHAPRTVRKCLALWYFQAPALSEYRMNTANPLVLVPCACATRLGCRVRFERGDRSLRRVRLPRRARVRRHPGLRVGQMPGLRRHIRHQPRHQVNESTEAAEASCSTTQPICGWGGLTLGQETLEITAVERTVDWVLPWTLRVCCPSGCSQTHRTRATGPTASCFFPNVAVRGLKSIFVLVDQLLRWPLTHDRAQYPRVRWASQLSDGMRPRSSRQRVLLLGITRLVLRALRGVYGD